MSDKYTLDDVDDLRPDSRHWIIPGAVRAGKSLLILGRCGAGKTLLAAEAAVSANTFTRFMGVLPPWMASRAIVVSHDVYEMGHKLKWLMRGRGEDDYSGLSFVSYNDAPSVVRLVHKDRVKLIVLDDLFLFEQDQEAIRSLLKLTNSGVTVVATTSIPRELGERVGAAGYNATLAELFDSWVVVIRDKATDTIGLETINGTPLVRATPVYEKEALRWEPHPLVPTTQLESDVWRATYRLKSATVGIIAKELGMGDRARKRLVQEALDDLEKKGAVASEKQYVSVGGKQHRVWRVILPEAVK